MKFTKKYTAVMAIALLSAASSLQAMEIKYTDVDLNGDGVVTEAEIINVVQNHFFSMDKDGNQSVSNHEWMAMENSER